MQLFAIKGAAATSMQEIAEQCGMSKGSLYLLFKSKDELERSIYIHCFRMIRDPLFQLELEEGLDPRVRLRSQVEILLSHVFELREFLQRQFRDLAERKELNPPEWLSKCNLPLTRWMQKKLTELYGEDILPYTGELMIVTGGMIHAYIQVLFDRNLHVSGSRMAEHLVSLIDRTAAALLAGRPEPLVPEDTLAAWLGENNEQPRKNHLQLLKEMRELLNVSGDSQPNLRLREDAFESLSILESELLLPTPRRAIVFGMLANLQSYPGLSGLLTELRSVLAPYLELEPSLACRQADTAP
jgi:AcrR family transcriptional regulator